MNELTVSQIIKDLDSLPNEGNLIGVMREICVMETRVATMMQPINERRTNQHQNFMGMVFAVLQPVYDQKEELGKDLPLISMRVYSQAITAAIHALSAEGIKVELNSNGKIKTPTTLGQYDTNVQRVLEHDLDGVFLDCAADGTYKYQSKMAVEKLGKDLAKAKKEAEEQAAIDRLLASGKGAVLGEAKTVGVQDKAKEQDSKPASTPNEETKPVAEETSVVGLAIAELVATINKWSASSGEMPTTQKGVSVDDHIISELTKLTGKLDRYFTDTCHLKLTDALNKAAAA